MIKKQMQEVMNEMALEVHRLKCKEFIRDRELEFCINFIVRLGLVDKNQMLDAMRGLHSKCRDVLETTKI